MFGKNGCFLSFEWVKRNFTTLPPLEKSFWLSLETFAVGPPWKKSFRRPCLLCNETESKLFLRGRRFRLIILWDF